MLNITGFWFKRAMRRRKSNLEREARASVPNMDNFPPVGISSRSSRRIRVLFPEPLGPIRPKISPWLMENEMSLMISFPSYCFEKDSASMTSFAHGLIAVTFQEVE